MKKLTDICDIQYGYAFDSKCFTEEPLYPPLVRIRDVKRGYSETYYSGDYSEEIFADRGVFERSAAAGGCGGKDVREVVLYL